MDDLFECIQKLSDEEFYALSKAKRGQYHPEIVDNPVWHGRILTPPSYRSCAWRGDWNDGEHPHWHFDRFGMSRTWDEDGNLVYIGGEHEDFYDPDFFIYNDVIVKRFDGTVQIYNYPPDVFSPTDFHSATRVNGMTYIIGGLGYPEDRIPGTTPVHVLIHDMMIRRIDVFGFEPGWIWGHDSLYLPDISSIAIWGGEEWTLAKKTVPNTKLALFNVHTETWSLADSIRPTVGAKAH